MPRTISRSPSYKRRRSPSPVSHRQSRRSRRDRSPSPYSRSHHRRRSPSPSHRRHKSRSPSERRHKRNKSRSPSRSPIRRSKSPSIGLSERKRTTDKLREEEEEKKRHFSEGRYCLSSKLLYLMIQLLLRLSTVHEFEKSFVWLRNLVEVCLKSINLYSDYCVVKVRFYADNGSNYKSLCMASHADDYKMIPVRILCTYAAIYCFLILACYLFLQTST
ncbi:uncharacterized protein At1g10890 isoform X3 [Cryptomeria japonica]|uniref:uncharacterized protein At1g10890 isoform X3 n=1 Tax=Cryptomeria japonica TaxID=3369 RepID=UPI0027DA58D2|nr:uncharacterized protein At1g10890 isoform X3 [Cryptomeria japonica]